MLIKILLQRASRAAVILALAAGLSMTLAARPGHATTVTTVTFDPLGETFVPISVSSAGELVFALSLPGAGGPWSGGFAVDVHQGDELGPVLSSVNLASGGEYIDAPRNFGDATDALGHSPLFNFDDFTFYSLMTWSVQVAPGDLTLVITSGLIPGGGEFTQQLTVTATPIPGALPLFASGLGVIGYFGWRRRQYARAA
jgi:hypothetical protein